MRKTSLVFGLLSGAVASSMMLLTLPFQDRLAHGNGALILGYTTIVLSFLFVYFGVRSFRERQPGGALTFTRAFGVGLAITLISCACYVGTWEFIYFKLAPDFVDKYAAHQIEKVRASGAPQAKIDETARQMADFKVMYNKPLMNVAITFLEPFPVGLLVTVVSAAVLRRRPVDAARV